ncbi:aspartyl protease family protein At5g10770-like [Dendrobium catenatum]|uniref:aspartyl protease family protein At5g10770-like n=1 Tax=Dendrobium catenatum TaxID=906689 RepID=UPI0009F68889|nr:aspartyl protease family protein At5g10770-like [Dendrobium catenatum]
MGTKGTSPSRFNVVHWHGLCTSRGRQEKPSHVELLRRDQAHVDYIQCRVDNTNVCLNPIGGSLFARVPTSIGLALGTSNYIVNIGLGTPTKSFSVMFDTGSDLTWTQCVPCVNCYTQKNPLYDPTQSSTFTDISCNSNYCTQLNRFGCSSTSTCLYEEEYEDHSSTNGSFIQDTLTFSSDIIHNFHFGCGHNNTGYFGQADGLLGLGRGAVSIISQTAQLYDNVFSYCLPSGSNKIGYLELGSTVPDVKYTPMLTNPSMPSSYFVKLIAISIGGRRLSFSPIETMLDSGASITYLPPKTYYALRSIFRKEMIKYPMAPPLLNLDTCYDLTGQPEVDAPEIVFIYEGEVTTYLDGSGILYMTKLSQACLAFAKTNHEVMVAIIGNMHQRTFNIVYDVGNLRIGFRSNGCS